MQLSSRFCLLFWVALLFLSGCQRRLEQSDRPDPLPQDTFVQVYMNQNQAKGADYTDPYRNITRPGDNLEQVIIDAINTAKSTIDIAVQEFRLPNIALALAEKQKTGVKVRVILENNYSRSWSEYSESEIKQLSDRDRSRYEEFIALVDRDRNKIISQAEIDRGDALMILRNAGIPVIDDTADGSKGSGLMHHKFMVVDRFTVVTGSANWTTSGTHGDLTTAESRGNANNILKINDTMLASLFIEEFNWMWGDGVGKKPNSKFGVQKPYRSPQKLQIGQSTITVQFSPVSASKSWQESSNGLIARTLNKATQEINLALFVFSEQKLVDAIGSRHQQGVEVKALIDPSFAFREYSEGLDMLGVAMSQKKCSYEPGNRPWQNPISTVGIPNLPSGDVLHHKVGVIDRTTVITGSHNWSATANNNNDETLLIIENPVVAAHYDREFNRLYNNSFLGLSSELQKKIAEREQNCRQK
ncbi:phospholipase D-like domain-containing protein [Spirulina sp. 06S082]|uniref:phospholipase D-like domain-containing protein n=1 Tax=Spirulina sp. 06S082 TaxID=3110248 RepID=UPI002B20400D|nr:phospholipase D-like domain-containing protein [Spirulina sp. 06S082]MEA5469900.1 phospholipase D-like domain-containing protein [Spirulina sp. 06S082]